MIAVLRKTIFFPFLFFCFCTLNSQTLSKRGFIKAVQEADVFYYYDQNYDKASVLYQSLLDRYPENSNLKAKLGICCLNLDGKNRQALKLLSGAVSNVVGNDKDYLEYGDKAPLDTYLYLAIAYHHNDSLQKAITLYTDAKKRLSTSKVFREEYIDNQIRDCMYAIEMQKKPLTLITGLFADWLKDYPGACNPVLAKNDSVFVFTQKVNEKTSVFCSYKHSYWRRPVEITDQLGGYDKFFTNSITGDGKTLIIYMDDGGDGNLYYSQRKDSTWSKIKSVGRPICTIYWQSHGFITPDGKGMYFASNMPGGEGELDIWYSEKNSSGKWGDPVNCGNTINTPYNEDTPFFDPETGALLFSSVGHMSMGGYDVFRSIKRNGTWTNPVGMPFAFNNILENTFFILNNNKPGFITSIWDDKTSSRNIYELVAEDPANKVTTAKGTITLQDGMEVEPAQTKIWLTDLKKPGTVTNIALSDTSSFKFEIKPGDYQLFVSHTGYKTDTINLSLPLYFSGNYLSVNSSLIPARVYGGEFLTIKNIYFGFDSCELDKDAIAGLDNLRNILITYPELQFEVAGYTDSKGGKTYNQKLADKRAQKILDYLTGKGIPPSRFIKKAFGKTNYVALNTNRDGTDNPEGRKYNRRVTFGIVDPGTGITIRRDTYTPEHLRQPFSIKYSIMLLKTGNKFIPDFTSLAKDELLFIRTIKSDSLAMYVLGIFYNKIEATKYLEYAKEKGFVDARILNQYELDNESNELLHQFSGKSGRNNLNQNAYTIQLIATRNALNIDEIFSGLDGVNEIRTEDGFYKYYFGEYESLNKAKQALLLMKKYGYQDAFIRNLYQLLF